MTSSPSQSPARSAKLMLGVMGVAVLVVVAVLLWIAVDTGDASPLVYATVIGLLAGGFLGSVAANLVGSRNRMILTRRRDMWAALTSRFGQWLLLVAFVAAVVTCVVAVVAVDGVHVGIWTVGVISVVGVVSQVMSLRNPLGIYLDPQIVAVVRRAGYAGRGKVAPGGTVAFTWDELGPVEVVGPKLTLGEGVWVGQGEIASDVARLARLIEFYRDNPRLRVELADQRVFSRLVDLG